MESSRTIIHLDLDAFFCAVEELRDPGLRGKPFAVGGRPEERGVVASCSYAARRFGVHSAMPMSRAVKLCPHLLILSSRYSAYGEASRQVMERLHDLTPLVEQISIDEAFLDISALPDPSESLARQLQGKIRDELGLPCSLGVASNKLVAKIATEVGKAASRGLGAPNALTIVPAGREAEFLAPLPVDMLWGVGPKTADRLEELGIRTIGDLAAWSENDLARRFGKNGMGLGRHARGIDPSPVVTEHETKSFSQEITFTRDVRDEHELRRTLAELSSQVAEHLRAHQASGRTVKLKLRWPDFTTLTRQTTLDGPTDAANAIGAAAIEFFEKLWSPNKAVRLLGVGVSGLAPEPRQLRLWDLAVPAITNQAGETLPVETLEQPEVTEKERRLQAAIAEIQARFGPGALARGPASDEGSKTGR
ncbi:MAG TPA: DNA polymerase IV [Anaerolineales bacterium]